ncbi:MAG: SDR family NAD(P)-dependent oxidoreductase [Chitinophagales bacterium]
MKIDLKNKTVWVVGASSGIGEGLIKQLSKENCKIVLSARRKNELERISLENNLHNQNSLILPLDISKNKTFKPAIETIISKFKSIDVLILNAGIAHKSYAEETLEEVDRRIMEVNFMGNIQLTKQVIPFLKSQNQATIAITSSILGEIGLPLVSTYCASKHAVNAYFESLRFELEKYKINISILSPGFINTQITKNSLTADGNTFNKNSVAQEKGMNANKCAKEMVKAIKNGKKRKKIGGLETFMPTVAYYFPSFFYWLMKKLHKLN